MTLRGRRATLLAVMMGVVAILSSLVLLEMSPALALEGELTGPMKQVAPEQPPAPDTFWGGVVYTDPASIAIQDLVGVVIGEGVHQGKLQCHNNCSQKTQLSLNGMAYEYQFKTIQAVDPVERSMVVAGMGSITSPGQKERFLFTATIQDNRNGTMWVRYEASRPNASFIVPNSAGTMTFRQQ